MRAIQTFCVHLLLFRYLLLSCSIVLFGLTTTRLNKTTTTTAAAAAVATTTTTTNNNNNNHTSHKAVYNQQFVDTDIHSLNTVLLRVTPNFFKLYR